MYKVSVIVPTYNRANLLQETIDSLLKQTYQDFELIIVDNGSIDGTMELVKNINLDRVKYFYQENSGGPGSPRNRGIEIASGEFIAFCDDDDLWESTKLFKQVAILENNPEYGLCFTKMKRFDDRKEWVNPVEEPRLNIGSRDLLHRNSIPISSVLVRKSLLSENGFFEESRDFAGSEDYELLLRLIKVTKFYCIPEYLVRYRSGLNRMTSANDKKSICKYAQYLRRIIRIYLMIVRKGFYRINEIFLPLIYNIWQVVKMTTYDLNPRLFEGIKKCLPKNRSYKKI